MNDWRDEQIDRLGRDLADLRSKLWKLESDVNRRFWERDLRILTAVWWLAIAIMVTAIVLAAADVQIG